MTRGYALNSQDIRNLIVEGRLVVPEGNFKGSQEINNCAALEKRVQPASFEPTLSGDGYVLDATGFKGTSKDSVYRHLLHLEKRKRRKIRLDDDHLLVGYSYLLKLNEKIKLSEGQRVKSSPKSTTGRNFLNTRLLVDYSASFDELIGREDSCVSDLWLLVQPMVFNVKASEGLTLNQLRFFQGLDSKLNDKEIIEEHIRNPMLLYSDERGTLTPAKIDNGELVVRLNLEGKSSSGIVGLMARQPPFVVDLSKSNGSVSEDYFEPVFAKDGRVVIEPEKYYLFSSAEILRFGPALSSEVRATHHTGIQGMLHFAGFIDPGFLGDLVFEVRSDELKPIALEHGMPISVLDVFRCEVDADKVYGSKIGSSYQGQRGPKVSKHFTNFDYKSAAKEHGKLDRLVLVEEKESLLNNRRGRFGFESIDSDAQRGEIIKTCEKGFFHSRYDCEGDPEVLQVIDYMLIFTNSDKVFIYRRSSDIKDYGDKRLFDKISIGVGGHVARSHGPDYIANCLRDKVLGDVTFEEKYSEPSLVGTLYVEDEEVDKDHFGLIYATYTDGEVRVKDKSIVEGNLVDINDLIGGRVEGVLESWTKALVPHLKAIRKQIGY
ncbi:2'-deoxycytidine 5'-triphosphate deaminase [Candidatus Woesearchaeota archaeon]|nr:2'-deoxycytidine 5'-triphosphate deaminase [Candidatus Woesearchaeota archaeon]